jgi:ParB family chromosome partitioning protein
MQIVQIDPSLIHLHERLRAVDEDYVGLLAESIAARGLDQPIRVTVADGAGFHRLISGAHRHAAVLKLGLPSIPAILFDGTALQAELMEIEENLIRRELSELDRATFLARHKAVWEALHPETKHGGDRRKKQVAKLGHLNAEHPIATRFTRQAAQRIGFSERTIRRAILRYEALSPDTRARIAGTWLADNGSALDALIGGRERRPEAEQQALLDILLAEGGPRSVAEAERRLRRLPPPDTDALRRARLENVWENSGRAAQTALLRRLLQDDEALDWIAGLMREAERGRRAA